jgi:4-alpha-glucanotransferase
MREAGVLLHVTALPGTPGSGTLGQVARDWVTLLGRHGLGLWQVLPLAPTDGGGSPYSSPSGSALNPALLDADDLVAQGLIHTADRDALPAAASDHLDLAGVEARVEALRAALLRRWPEQNAASRNQFARWCRRQRAWLPDHCRFMVLRRQHGGLPWWQWPAPLRQRQSRALRQLEATSGQPLLAEALLQWQLESQWQALRRHARSSGVTLLGDLPFYVAHDSADVWAHPALFSLADQHDGSRLAQQSGVPPDYFASTGQLWGTPVYRWPLHLATGLRWWRRRLRRQFELVDLLRLDHFRALAAYWSVPGADPTAEHGHWRPSPGGLLLGLLWLEGLAGRFRLKGLQLPLIAEDLGVITPAVELLRDGFGLPGMKILHFAFDGDPANPYLPANYKGSRWLVYTGTHDNATSIGWWQQLDHDSRQRVEAAVGHPITAPGWHLAELALASSAATVIVPLQDLLELGDEARFNTPGTTGGNWCWRLNRSIDSLDGPLKGYGEIAARYGRGPGGAAGQR